MNRVQRGVDPASSLAQGLRRRLARLRESLEDLAAPQRLSPALVPVAVGASRQLPPPTRLNTPELHLAFGRKKEPKAEEQEEGQPEQEPDLTHLPPIPSAVEVDRDERKELGPPQAATPADGEAPQDAKAGETAPETDLRTWSVSEGEDSEAAPEASENGARAWEGNGEGEGRGFTPSVVRADQSDDLGWLRSDDAEEAAAWEAQAAATADAAEAASEPEATDEPQEAPAVIEEVEEIEAEAPAGESATGEAEGLDSYSEVLTTEAESEWQAPPEPAYQPPAEPIYHPSPAPVPVAQVDGQALETRSFPLPEGEMVFRNLRVGFTDPSRLLRHLAGEGHTGVLHVQGADGTSSYVVLVDGYVVAVATDRQGVISTTRRIAFPNFPNSQDTIHVVSYPRQIARGLGLLLHAPVRFQGLGAMFVNLEGLRSYLSKYSSSGGLIVHAQDGTGVALFEDGKLVGAYANGNLPTTDLAQLRDLVKDLEAEIDVRFGGPPDLDPTPLDTLLSGYPL